MATLMQASTQWANRPADERFTSLDDLLAHTRKIKNSSSAKSVSTRRFEVRPVDDTNNKGLAIAGDLPGDNEVALPSHWAFGQLALRSNFSSAELRKLPNFLVADILNWQLQHRPVDEVGLLVHANEDLKQPQLAAATGPNYGRIWNEEIVSALVNKFGDGVTGRFKVPGMWGKALDKVTKQNTTLFAGDRDMFVFLADEENRIEVPERRNGLMGSVARGFFAWNSEVGDNTMGVASFLFDEVCENRIVWGAQDFKEIKLRHTSGAPDRFVEELRPALISMANSSTYNIEEAIANARQAKIDNVDEFLLKRFTKSQTVAIKFAHENDENKPIETVWDAVTGITAYARGIEYQDQRVGFEREAGKLLKKAA